MSHDVDDRSPENATASRLFDLRTIIGGLFVLYGAILAVAGIFDSAEEVAKADGIRINLWLGLAMLALGALFLLWVRLRPVRLPRRAAAEADPVGRRPGERGPAAQPPGPEHRPR
jgi:hypothetical protein